MNSKKTQNSLQNNLLNRFNSVLVFILFLSFTVSCVSKKKVPVNDILGHGPRNILKNFRFVDSTHFVTGSDYYAKPTEIDSTLLVSNYERRIFVSSPIYISDHEVTNAEYREFTNWVLDSIALTLLANKNPSYYVDRDKKTLDWSKRSTIWIESNLPLLDSLSYQLFDRYYNRRQIDTRKILYNYYDGQNNISIFVYPDTTIWAKEFRYADNDPFTRSYFSHPRYNNYPIVGISWQQAIAYCHWKTDRLKEIISDKYLLKINCRLPTELEWENAAYGYPLQSFNENIDNKRIYPWDGLGLFDKNGKYRANFGAITDQNMLGIKYELADGAFYTSQTKSYPPNTNNIYDMAGNVAEWTLDVPRKHLFIIDKDRFYRGNVFISDKARLEQERYNDSLNSVVNKVYDLYRITPTDSLPSAIEKTKAFDKYYKEKFGSDRSDWLSWWDLDGKLIEKFATAELHDAKVLAAHNNFRIVKGGSWATGPAYMLISSREVFPENKCSSRVGFRVVLDFGK